MPDDLIFSPPPMAPTIVLSGDLIAGVGQLEEHLGALPAVTNQESCDAVRAVMNRAGEMLRAVNAQRLNAKAPWAQIVQQIDDAAKPITARLQMIVNEVKHQLAAFAAEQDRIRAAAARAQAIAQAAAAEALRQGQAPQLQVTVQPEVFELPTRKDQELRIIDENLIPAQYWIRDDTKIRAHLKSGIAVPGAELITVTTIVNR